MTMPEDELHHQQSTDNAPLIPTSLPPDLAEFLRAQRYACLTHATDRGVVLVVKIPGIDIESARGTVPIHFQHELYEHPAAPVIRIVTTIYDQPRSPLRLETFANVEDPQQRSDYAALAEQQELFMLFFDEALQHRLTKAVGGLDNPVMLDVLQRADQFLAGIPPGQVNFDLAKAAVMETTQL